MLIETADCGLKKLYKQIKGVHIDCSPCDDAMGFLLVRWQSKPNKHGKYCGCVLAAYSAKKCNKSKFSTISLYMPEIFHKMTNIWKIWWLVHYKFRSNLNLPSDGMKNTLQNFTFAKNSHSIITVSAQWFFIRIWKSLCSKYFSLYYDA